MFIEVMNSKIHRAKVTDANLNYIGSVTIDEDWMDEVGILTNQQVHIVNVTNGERYRYENTNRITTRWKYG